MSKRIPKNASMPSRSCVTSSGLLLQAADAAAPAVVAAAEVVDAVALLAIRPILPRLRPVLVPWRVPTALRRKTVGQGAEAAGGEEMRPSMR